MHRMSDHCHHCEFDPRWARGESACPVTTLYWDFLDRHLKRFRLNRRLVFQIRNAARTHPAPPPARMAAIRASHLKSGIEQGEPL